MFRPVHPSLMYLGTALGEIYRSTNATALPRFVTPSPEQPGPLCLSIMGQFVGDAGLADAGLTGQ